MTRPTIEIDIAPAGFFAFRTPLLPIEELEAWNDGLAAPAAAGDEDRLAIAVQADRELLRSRLRRLVDRPEIREALFVASPSLTDGLDAWLEAPDSKKGRRAEEALVRYVQRMMTRATPFGLFSGCSLGLVDSTSRLELEPRRRYQRHTRLDMDYLFALAEDQGHDAELRRHLTLRPNSSLYLAAGRWRYAEARLAGRMRSHHLVAVETSEYLEEALNLARDGATVAELAQALVNADPDGEVTFEEAEEFVFELVDSQMLVTDLSPLVTGPEAIHELIDQFAAHPETREVRQRLEHVRSTLEKLDDGGVGGDPETYRGIAHHLEELPTRVTLPRLFQVDMIKPAAHATLGSAVITEMRRAVDLLWRLAGPAGEDSLTRFCQDFVERYEDGQTVPLVEVLDEEVGIGFDRSRGADASPLLEGLAFPPREGDRSIGWGAWPELLLRKIEPAIAAGAREIEIGEDDLAGFERAGLPSLPDGLEVMATVAAASARSFEQGDFRLAMRSVSGPSGAQLLGRFCHADPELQRHVEAFLREEEKLRPDAVFAEVVHLPEGRIGNILSRPVMRGYEIPYLGRGGCDAEHQVPVDDLLVTVSGPRIRLFSKRLGRRVLPRLTSAHNYGARSLGIYRFLCALQSHRLRGGLGWSWSVFESLPFLPRVTAGRLVLARARWNVKRSEIRPLLEAEGAGRFHALMTWRHERRMPRRVLLGDSDNELLVDFDNVLSTETFLALVKDRPGCVLVELFPDVDELWATGPEGRFVCELIVPFLRRREPSPDRPSPIRAPPAARDPENDDEASLPPFRRAFAPGSEWLYAKLYTGTSTADQLLAGVVGPLARQAMASGAADHWFFIRYGDPHWHLRLRFHGEPRRLLGEVLPRLTAAVGPLLEDGRMWRFQLDTYQREVERYGGPDGTVLAERLSHADSEAVLAIVELLEGDEGAAVRWRLAVRGIDQLIADLGIEGEEKMRLLERIATGFAQEFQVDKGFKKQMADRLRAERRELDALLDARADQEHPLAPGLLVLDRRSEVLRPVAAELRARQEAGRLTLTVDDMASSYIHMFCNRLLRSDGRAHEVVLYDFVHRLALSRLARARGREKKKQKKSS